MAKNKSKKKNQSVQSKISPQRFMRDKARQLPIGKCFISPPDWKEHGMAQVFITRERKDGNLVLACFLVDIFCLGVKNTWYGTNVTEKELKHLLSQLEDEMGFEEISYNEAHNLILGAIEFAEEGGVGPAGEFLYTQFILEEDTDDIPLIEYDYGMDGKHLLIAHNSRDKQYINILKRNLGDNFEFIMRLDDDDDDDSDDVDLDNISPEKIKEALDNMTKMFEETKRLPQEKYAYQHPEYPGVLNVKHQFLVSELFDPDNYSALPRETIERILSLPKDEIAQDISNIILFVIGQTYARIDDSSIEESYNSVLIHCLVLLAQIQSDKALEAVLEIMRQNIDFSDYHLGDIADELLSFALYACGRNNIEAIEKYLNEPGFDPFVRCAAPRALVTIALNHPERREEIIELFRRLLVSMKTRFSQQEVCDGNFAGMVVNELMDLGAKELIPEIKDLFATDCVDKYVAGDCNKVVKELKAGCGPVNEDTYQLPDIYAQYEDFKRWLKKPEAEK